MSKLVVNVALLSGWLLLHAPVVGWLAEAWLRQEGQLHLVLAVGLLALVARTLDPRGALARLAQAPRASLAALALAAGPPLAAAVARRWWPLDVVDATAAVASAYGLVGLYVDAGRWRQLRGPALLVGAVLPLTGYLDVYLGYPLRRLTAQAVAALLGSEVTAGTVLAVDGGYAHVDLPCSGVKSLWSGAVVLLGAAVTWRRPVDLGWAAIVAGVAALLVVANGARVLAVVGAEHVAGLPLLAEIVHVPLGVIGFVAALAPGLAALWGRAPAPAIVRSCRRSRLAAPALAAALAVAVGIRALPAPEPARAPVPALPADFAALAPTDQELGLVAARGGAIAKGRFERGVRGTVVIVSSTSWLAHHVPEACLEAAGLDLVDDHPARVGGAPVRFAAAASSRGEATALWWFQSVDTVTDDHVVRIRAGLASDEPWVLVSVLIEGAVDPADPAVAALVTDLRASAADTLGGA